MPDRTSRDRLERYRACRYADRLVGRSSGAPGCISRDCGVRLDRADLRGAARVRNRRAGRAVIIHPVSNARAVAAAAESRCLTGCAATVQHRKSSGSLEQGGEHRV